MAGNTRAEQAEEKTMKGIADFVDRKSWVFEDYLLEGEVVELLFSTVPWDSDDHIGMYGLTNKRFICLDPPSNDHPKGTFHFIPFCRIMEVTAEEISETILRLAIYTERDLYAYDLSKQEQLIMQRKLGGYLFERSK